MPTTPIVLTFSDPVNAVLGLAGARSSGRRLQAPGTSPTPTPSSSSQAGWDSRSARRSVSDSPAPARPRRPQPATGAAHARLAGADRIAAPARADPRRARLPPAHLAPAADSSARAPPAVPAPPRRRRRSIPRPGHSVGATRRAGDAAGALATPRQRPRAVRGAIMAFESVHGLPTDGVPSPALWRVLLDAELAGRPRPYGYSYVFVTETLPETLTLWHNGRVVLQTPVNTGIPGRGDGARHLPGLPPPRLDDDDGHQSERHPLLGPRRPLGQLLQRRRRRARLHPRRPTASRRASAASRHRSRPPPSSGPTSTSGRWSRSCPSPGRTPAPTGSAAPPSSWR